MKMNKTTTTQPLSLLACGLLACGLLACLTQQSGAATILFTENFNTYSGTQNTTQYETGLNVAHTGSVAGWSNSGEGTIHAVDLDTTAGVNWAPMFFQNNVITQTVGIAANNLNASYELNFDYGTAIYAAGNSGQRTLAADSLLVEVLRANNTVLASGTYTPGAWDTVGNRNLDAGLKGTLSYIGDGTGVVRLRIGPAGTLNSGRFEGEIDNLSVSLIPEPSAALLGGLGLLTLLRRRK
jgi:hypothetical protein